MVKVWLENKQNWLKKCHATMSHDKHVNEKVSNMSRHVNIPWSKSSLETKKLTEKKCHAPFSHKHVNENMSNMTRHVIIQWAKSSLKTKKSGLKNCLTPFHMISMSTKTCHDMSKCHAMLSCQRLTLVCAHVNVHPPMSKTRIPASVLSMHVKFNHYKKTGFSGVKGRVGSYSIYKENLKLVRSVQRVSNPDQNVKFNQYKKAGS